MIDGYTHFLKQTLQYRYFLCVSMTNINKLTNTFDINMNRYIIYH